MFFIRSNSCIPTRKFVRANAVVGPYKIKFVEFVSQPLKINNYALKTLLTVECTALYVVLTTFQNSKCIHSKRRNGINTRSMVHVHVF